jgi:hypothetical protein
MSSGSDLLAALGLTDDSATLYVTDELSDGGLHWHERA